MRERIHLSAKSFFSPSSLSAYFSIASFMNLMREIIPSAAGRLKSVSCAKSAPETTTKRITSAPNSFIAARMGNMLPMDLLIFFPSMSTKPLVAICRGQYFFSNIATWLKMKKVRWLCTRSVAECLLSSGYQ